MLIILVIISLIAKSDGQTVDSCFYACKYDHIQKGLHFSREIQSLLPSALYSDELSGEHHIDDTRRWNNMDKPHKWILNTKHYDEYRPFEELLRDCTPHTYLYN